MASDFPAHWFARLTSFDPPRELEAPPDWDEAVRLLAHHGLAAIAAYNLQYRMPRADAPESAKDVLLGYYQGLANDNVYKLVTLKQLVSGVAGPHVVLLDAAAYTDTLYPHVAFRPVPDLRVLVPERDVDEVARVFAEHRFVAVDPGEEDPDEPRLSLTDGRIDLLLFTKLGAGGDTTALLERTVRARAFGPAAARLSAEDSVLAHVLSQAHRGFVVPLVTFVDLRELVRGGAAGNGGPGAPVDARTLRERARELGAEKALWAALELLCRFHPSVELQARALQPELGLPVRTLLDAAVVRPGLDAARERQLRAHDRLVRLLLG